MAGETNGTSRIHIQIPCRLDLLNVVDKVVEGVTEQMGFEDLDRDAIAISVVEASTNAIQHGGEESAGATFEMTFLLHEDRLEVRVHDHGTGFTPDLSGEPSPPDLLSTRGRGIYIMRSMMDDVSFDFSDGTQITLVKKRSAPEGGGDSEA
jgi:serine/threonine-protein kinase RsbW